MITNLLRKKHGNVLASVAVIFSCIFLIGVLAVVYNATSLFRDVLVENKKLKQSIMNLTTEDQIGYAKVIKQEKIDDTLFTTLKFIETARDDKNNNILEKSFTIEGDVVHFDALIVKFSNQMVMDGKERSLYLWRRVYGEKMSPHEGFPIEEEGIEPKRYENFLGGRTFLDKMLFKKDNTKKVWKEIWSLANDPEKRSKEGITALYGNVVYSKLKPGLIYVFKISNTGQVYPETVPDM